jgi:hypothetical protein
MLTEESFDIPFSPACDLSDRREVRDKGTATVSVDPLTTYVTSNAPVYERLITLTKEVSL